MAVVVEDVVVAEEVVVLVVSKIILHSPLNFFFVLF